MQQRDLSKAVSDEVAAALSLGAVHVSAFAEGFAERHPDLVDGLARDLALRALRAMVRKVCKVAAERQSVPLFPEFGDAIPRAIAVPRGANDEQPYYVGLDRASFGELCASEQMLSCQIEADTRRRDAIRALRMKCEEMGARPEDRVADVVRRSGLAA